MTMENTGPQISHDKNCAIDPTGNFRTQLAIPCSVSFLGGEKWWKKYSTMHTVDGRNPARRTSWGYQFISCLNIQTVVVWVFWTINNMICVPPPPKKKTRPNFWSFNVSFQLLGGVKSNKCHEFQEVWTNPRKSTTKTRRYHWLNAWNDA